MEQSGRISTMATILLRGEETQTHTQRVKMDTEIGVIHLQAKEHQGLLASPKARNDVRNRSFSQGLQKDQRS